MKLLLIAPCQIALQDPEQGHSLIAIFHDILIKLPETSPAPPPNAIIPREWAIFTKFALEPNEEGKDYALATNIFWPDETSFVSQVLHAAQPTKNGMAFIAKLQGFPMGQNGKVRITQQLFMGDQVVSENIETDILVRVERVLQTASPGLNQ